MPEAHIVHDGYGFRCATLNLALPLASGLTAAPYCIIRAHCRKGGSPPPSISFLSQRLRSRALRCRGRSGAMNRRRRRCLTPCSAIIWRATRSGSCRCGCVANAARRVRQYSLTRRASSRFRRVRHDQKARSIAATIRKSNARSVSAWRMWRGIGAFYPLDERAARERLLGDGRAAGGAGELPA